MSQFIQVEITISQLLQDLRAGLTWYANELPNTDSIQEKYEMENEDVEAIKQHPAFLKPIRTFKIIDDVTKTVQPMAPPEVVAEVLVSPEPEPEMLFSALNQAEPSPAVLDSLFGEFENETNLEQEPEEVSSDGALDFMSL